MHQQRVQEFSIGASSSMSMSGAMSNTDAADRVVDENFDSFIFCDVGTTEGNPIVEPVGSRKLDLSASL